LVRELFVGMAACLLVTLLLSLSPAQSTSIADVSSDRVESTVNTIQKHIGKSSDVEIAARHVSSQSTCDGSATLMKLHVSAGRRGANPLRP
jgi:hypothetical protein